MTWPEAVVKAAEALAWGAAAWAAAYGIPRIIDSLLGNESETKTTIITKSDK